jgi:O-antigen ligase
MIRYLILFLLALAFLGMEIGIGGARLIYTIPGVSLVALAGVLAIFLVTRTDRRPSTWGLASALAFAAYILARNRLSEIDHLGRMQFYIMAGTIIMYLLAALFLTEPRHRKYFFYFLMFLAVIQVAVGFYQFAKVNGWMPLPWAQRRDDVWRASGFFISPNHFSGYLEIIGLMALSLLVWSRSPAFGRVLLGYVVLVCAAGVAISGSRGGYLSLTFGFLVFFLLSLYAWYHVRRQQFAVIATGAAIGGLAIFSGLVWMMFQSNTLKLRVMAINDPENMRFLLWDSAIEQFFMAPWFGTGAFSFFYYGRLLRNPAVQHDPIHVHNDYLQLLADYGLVGAVLFLLLLLIHLGVGIAGMRVLLRRLSQMQESQGDGLALVIGAISVIGAYLVHSVVDFNMHLTVNALLIGFLFGILATTSSSVAGFKPVSPGPLAVGLRYFLPLGAIALLIYGVPQIRGEYFAERARVALRDYQLEDALKFAQEGLKTEKNNPDLYYYAGEAAREMAFQKMGNVQELQNLALVYLQQGVDIFPYDSRTSLKLAHAWSQAGDYFEASNAIAQAEDWDPQSSFVHAYKGLVELEDGSFEAAQDAFEESIRLGGEGSKIAREGLKVVQQLLAMEEEEFQRRFPGLSLRDLTEEQMANFARTDPAVVEATEEGAVTTVEIPELQKDLGEDFDPLKIRSMQDLLDWEKRHGAAQEKESR